MYRPYAVGALLSLYVVLIQVATNQVVRGQFSFHQSDSFLSQWRKDFCLPLGKFSVRLAAALHRYDLAWKSRSCAARSAPRPPARKERFSRSYLSPKRYTPADGQTVNLGIIFGFFSPCAPHLRNGWYCGTGKSLRCVLCAFGRDIRSISVTGSYRTVHKIFRTNLLRISSDSDII